MTDMYVHTLGDSTLDNLKWELDKPGTNLAQAKRNCVEGQLEKALNAQGRYTVISHAYDGFTTSSLLHGDTVGAVLPESASTTTYLQEKAPGVSKIVYPLLKLQKAIDLHPDAVHYVVLSVGGNDFRENLGAPWRLLPSIPSVQQRYVEIVEKIKNLKGKNIRPILMFQYRTDANNDLYGVYTILGTIGKVASAAKLLSIAAIGAFLAGTISKVKAALGVLLGLAAHQVAPGPVSKTVLQGENTGVAMIGSLMETFYQPMLERARVDKIPILDLPNTFNPYARLYTSGIEPNKAGAALIAEGLAHIITTHDYTQGSRLYAKTAQDSAYTATKITKQTEWKVLAPLSSS
jgi:lysophospholipase L1-like esterase